MAAETEIATRTAEAVYQGTLQEELHKCVIFDPKTHMPVRVHIPRIVGVVGWFLLPRSTETGEIYIYNGHGKWEPGGAIRIESILTKAFHGIVDAAYLPVYHLPFLPNLK